MAMKSVSPAAAPRQPSPRARALASLSTNVGRPVASASRRPQREVPPGGDVEGRDRPRRRRSSARRSRRRRRPPRRCRRPSRPPPAARRRGPRRRRSTGVGGPGRGHHARPPRRPARRPAWSPRCRSPGPRPRPSMSHPLGTLVAVTAPITTTRVAGERRGVPRWRLAGRFLARRRGGRDERPGFPTSGGGGRILRALADWCRRRARSGPGRLRRQLDLRPVHPAPARRLVVGRDPHRQPPRHPARPGRRGALPLDVALRPRPASARSTRRRASPSCGWSTRRPDDPRLAPAAGHGRLRRRDRGSARATCSPLPSSRASTCRSTTSSPGPG